MKKDKRAKRLTLDHELVKNLSEVELTHVAGGGSLDCTKAPKSVCPGFNICV